MISRTWNTLEWGTYVSNYDCYINGLHYAAEKNKGFYDPVPQLWLSVLIDAAKYRDMKFATEFLIPIAKMNDLDPTTLAKGFRLIWEQEDANKQK